MGRNPWNVMNVGRPSVAGQSFLCIKGYTMEGNPLSSVTVGKPLRPGAALPCIRKSTVGRSLMSALTGNPSLDATLQCIRGSTLERSSVKVQKWEGLQWEYRLYQMQKNPHWRKKNPTSVLSVGRLSVADLTSNIIYYGEKPYGCNLYGKALGGKSY